MPSEESVDVAVIASTAALRAGLCALLSADPRLLVTVSAASLEEWSESQRGADVIVFAGSGALFQWNANWEEPISAAVLWLLEDAEAAASLARRWKGQAAGLLPLDSSAEELLAAVHALAEGLAVFHPAFLSSAALTGLHAEHSERRQVEPPLEALTARELQVLQHLARGLTNRQIALQLGISEHTVKFHISSIYSKLQVLNRAEAVQVGIRLGMIGL